MLAATEDCRVFMLECAIADLYSIVKQAFAETRQLYFPPLKVSPRQSKSPSIHHKAVTRLHPRPLYLPPYRR